MDDTIQEVRELVVSPNVTVQPSSRKLSFKLDPIAQWLLLSETRFKCSMRIVGEGDEEIAAASAANPGASFDNAPPITMVRSLEIRDYSGTIISPPDENYGISAYLIMLRNYDSETLNKKYESSLFFFEASPSSTNAVAPSGFKKRQLRTSGSEWVEVSCPLFSPLFMSHYALPAMCGLSFSFNLASNHYIIKSGMPAANAAHLKYEIRDPVLQFKKLHVTSEFAMNFEKILVGRPARFELSNFMTKSYVIGTGRMTFQQPDVFGSSFVPLFATVFLTTQAESVGQVSNSIFSFRPHGIRRIRLLMGDEQCPASDEILDFSNNIYLSAFERFVGDNWSSSTSPIDMDLFKDQYCFFHFSMNQIHCMNTRKTKKLGACTLSIDFHAATTETLVAYVFFCENQTLLMGADRKFVKNY